MDEWMEYKIFSMLKEELLVGYLWPCHVKNNSSSRISEIKRSKANGDCLGIAVL